MQILAAAVDERVRTPPDQSIAGGGAPAIETRGLRRTFRGRRGEVVAVEGVDLVVAAGEIFGFLGPNGAGKTTALRMLATLLPPSGGEARVAGHDLRREPQRVRVSPLGLAVMLGLLVPLGLLFASVSYSLALWLRSEDSMAALLNTVTMPLLLLSGILLPLSLAPGWLRGLAAANPLSYAVEAARALFNERLGDPSIPRALAILVVLAVCALVVASRAFRRAAA
jgi:energy-coupling factor transporter ATP-binding protein EcfA2